MDLTLQGKDNPNYIPSATLGQAGSLDPTINSSNLTPVAPINIPVAPVNTTNYAGMFGGTNAMIGANAATLTPQTTEQPTSLDALMASINTPVPSATDTYNTDYANSGVATATANANADAAVYQSATDKYNALNSQLQQYNYNASTIIPLQGQKDASGQGVTAGGFGSYTSAQLRDNALAAAPVQFNALIAQAEQAAALGKAQLSQSILQQAQTQMNTIYKIHMDDAQAKYTAKTNVLGAIYDYLTNKEKATADDLKQKAQNDFTLQRDAISSANDYAKTAITNGQGDIAGKLMALDPKDPAYSTKVAALASQIVTPVKASAGGGAGDTVKLTEGERVTAATSNFSQAFVPGAKLPSGIPVLDSEGFLTPEAFKAAIADAPSEGLSRSQFLTQFGYLLVGMDGTVSTKYGLTPTEIKLIGATAR